MAGRVGNITERTDNMTQETGLAKVNSIKALINKDTMRQQIAMALPKFLTAERFTRVMLTMLSKTPKLAECTQESLLSCMMDCASSGLPPDGRLVHLIPYGDKCTLIFDYKGLIELGRRSGQLKDWYAEIVCENDDFDYNLGQVTKHRIDFRKPRGEMYAVYSCAIFKDDSKSFCVMTKDECESIRKRSKAATTGPWKTDYTEMCKKTVIRRHSKTLPLSAEFHDALGKDFDSLKDIEPLNVSEPLMAPQRASESTPEPEKEPETEVLPPEEPDVKKK